MFRKIPKAFIQIITGLTIVIIFTLIANAFTEPTVSPPDGNVDAPINVGSLPQIKAGSIEAIALRGSGIRVGDTDSVVEFLQIDAINVPFYSPDSGQCTSVDWGRMFYNVGNDELYICNDAGWHRLVTKPL